MLGYRCFPQLQIFSPSNLATLSPDSLAKSIPGPEGASPNSLE
jgi:hypothetical protein